MKKLILFLLTFVPLLASAQFDKTTRYADLALSVGDGFSASLSANKLYGVGKSNRFKIGYGLRLTNYFGGQTDARTAPAHLTSGKSSFAALFAEDILTQIDTLTLKNVQTHALNLSINLQYSISKKLEVGVNIDAIGVTFGGSQNVVTFKARQSDAQGRANNGKSDFTASPTGFNLLLISDSDLGSLNSEVYARYWLNDKWGIRAGLGFQFNEYTTSRKLAFDNDRFRSKVAQPMIAVSYKF
jgi:hypothetical protein